MSISRNKEKVRELIFERFQEDLMGPIFGEQENLDRDIAPGGPDDEYILGKLYPKKTEHTDEVLEEIDEEKVRSSGKSIRDEGVDDDHPKINKTFNKPSSIGLSFFLAATSSDIELEMELNYGKYTNMEEEDQEGKKRGYFTRTQMPQEDQRIKILGINTNDPKLKKIQKTEFSELLPEVKYGLKIRKWKEMIQVTLVILNDYGHNDSDSMEERNEKIFFQCGFKVRAKKNCKIVPLPSQGQYSKTDPINSMLYRDRLVYAVGHNCSADWDQENQEIFTTWTPSFFVPDIAAEGSMDEVYNAIEISKLEEKELISKLKILPTSYQQWIEQETSIIKKELAKKFANDATQQKKLAQKLLNRIKKSIDFLESNSDLIEAFRLANKTMAKAASWRSIDINWFPFQLGFFLLALESTINSDSEERNVADLLWFPTGGGKTEAYLLLMVTVLFYRKFKNGGLNAKDGLAVFTRYTLRALTLDQFTRMVATISAAEIIRRETIKSQNEQVDATRQFSVGMWVGRDATPNFFEGERGAWKNPKKVQVIKNCPACGNSIDWKVIEDLKEVTASCTDNKCVINKKLNQLPIYVVDEEIYEVVPSVVIGTVDKFVQVIRKPWDARKLFSLDSDFIKSPDLIIQDELHLISGPLGSVTGGIEMIIEEYCKKGEKTNVKVIASTATIQRAGQQIMGLYGKTFEQFPVNITNPDDSFFAVVEKNSPGRIYTAVTTACASSGTYMLQGVAASLLQSIQSSNLKNYSNNEKDPFSTLVCYFNNLRTLSGARILLQEDVTMAIEAYAKKRKEVVLKYDSPEELTSFADQNKISEILTNLAKHHDEDDHITALLASVMISVGLDIPRLGLMLVNNQPKTMSEYIQATSRVGRGSQPGLIVTILNEFKPRDKSHYENFVGIHNNLYRYVETTSVTPFSPRARQKLLDAILVAISVKRLNLDGDYHLRKEHISFIEQKIIPSILDRVEKIDPLERNDTEIELKETLGVWSKRRSIKHLWDDAQEFHSLLVSAETRAALNAIGTEDQIAFQSPNSCRTVEPSVQIKAWPLVTERFLTRNN